MDGVEEKSLYRRWQIKIFAATWLAYAGYYFCRKPFYVVKGAIQDSLGLTSVQLGHLGTAYLLFYMVGQFSSAYFGKKLGPKLLLLFGMGISIFCNVVFGISNGFWTILLFLALNGLAQGTGWPGCIGSLAFWFKRKQRGTILGFWATCYQIGSVVATSYAAFLLGKFGWRYSFFGASLVLLIIWGIVLLLHPNTPEDVGLKPIKDDDDEKSSVVEETSSEKDKNSNGWTRDVVITIVLMGLVYFSIKFLRYALWSWTPYFLNRNFHLAGDDAGYLSTVFDISGFIGVLFAGYVSDKIFKGRRALISFLMLFFMLIAFIMMYTLGAKSVLFFTISMGIAGFMLYGPDSLLSGVGAIDVGSKRGALQAAGIINGMGSIGPIFQEEIIGYLYKAYNQNLAPILLLLVGMALLGASITFFIYIRSLKGKSNL